MNFNSDMTKESIVSASLINYNNNKYENYITRTLTYSFKYKSVTYEYNEETNEIIPVYMNLTKMTNKGIFNYFGEGLSSENLVKAYLERYGKNEYYINLGITHFYFKKIEALYLIFILIVEGTNLFFKDSVSFFLCLGIIVVLFLLEYLVTKQMIYDLYKKEFTLDGEENKIKVRRKHKIKGGLDFYYEIKNCELLPGDIVYLKTDDVVPCDCLILEGECIVNENSLNGSLDITKKKSLENKNEQFNYKFNKIHLLYHGMKIVKTISRFNEGYISALCINTGPNTYKANQYSNILYLFERKEEYRNTYEIFGQGRKIMVLVTIIIMVLTISLGFAYFFSLNVNLNFHNSEVMELFYTSLVRIFCKSCMPVYFLTNSIIYFVGVFHLKRKKIFCFEKSKLISPGNIDTIFLSKTGILCESNFKINGYHPFHMNPHRPNVISYVTYTSNQCKEMNTQLLKFYKSFLFKKQNDNLTRKKLKTYKMNQESNECITLFLECLLSCNNIEKYNNEIFGNIVETEIFQNMKWDIKSYRFNNTGNKNFDYNNDCQYLNEKNNNDINNFYYDDNMNLIDSNINDIYPNNYYKITETYKNEDEDEYEDRSRFNSQYSKVNKKNPNSNQNVSEFSFSPEVNPNQNTNNLNNFIKKNISESHIISYKLRIFKRFIKNGTLNSSAIVYNFITKELKFMTKGIPEDILDKCDKNTIPDNFDNIISTYRRRGFILIICAYKIINIDNYNDSNTIEEYMNNLTFCGFVSLKNKLKKEIVNTIKDLREFNCNLIISTGDNVYNCLPVAFDSTLIENKNIFALDKDDKKNNITITKIFNLKKEGGVEQEENSVNLSVDKLSKNMGNKTPLSPYLRAKDKFSKTSFENFSLKQAFEENDKKEDSSEIKRAQFKHNSRIVRQNNVQKKFQATKNLLEYNKNLDKKKVQKYYYTELKNQYTEKNNSNVSTLNISKNKISNKSDFKEYQDSTNRKLMHYSEQKSSKNLTNLEKIYYYPGIFEDQEDLANNCIYCTSGKAFNFLYKNKDRKRWKYLLEFIHNNCKIFFSMSSIDKSLAVDFYREYPNSCICTIGKHPNDFDAMMTSNVGINFNPPKNENTILCHFYSVDSSVLSIKQIIKEGRTMSENILLLKITCFFYTLILNSYVLCCFMMEVGVIKGQLNFLEICFLILSISAFTVQYDNSTNSSNPLIQNRKLYMYHYVAQIMGMFGFKIGSIYMLRKFYTNNNLIDKKVLYKLFITYYFILCIEQLFSVFFIFNYIYFYRKHPLTNIFFVFFNLILFIYFIVLITLNSSNFKWDLFKITDFEFNDELIDSFDDNIRIKCSMVCGLDFCFSFIYSRIIYFIFDKLAKNRKFR
jgi:magnesium-transporting ATPase (P-type)